MRPAVQAPKSRPQPLTPAVPQPVTPAVPLAHQGPAPFTPAVPLDQQRPAPGTPLPAKPAVPEAKTSHTPPPNPLAASRPKAQPKQPWQPRPLEASRPKAQPKLRGVAPPVTELPPPPTPALPPKPKPASHGQLGSELPSQRISLQWDRRWGSWQQNAVEIGACVWADLRVEGDPILSKLKKEIEAKLGQALGADAVVAIQDEDFEKQQRLFVCLLAKAEECVELRIAWKSMKLLGGAAQVSWKDTIDTASQHHCPSLKECWNPERLQIDSMSLAIPARWAFHKGNLPSNPPVACADGSHWHSFARIFGDVLEASLTWKGEACEMIYLVVRFSAKGGPKQAYRDLTGRCLSNPLSSKNGTKDVCLVRAVYGTYQNLLDRVLQVDRKSKHWLDAVDDLPEPPGKGPMGPIFELFPLQPRFSGQTDKRLRLSPWGPPRVKLGRSQQCQLRILHEGISNEHVELCLMVPWNQHSASNLSVHVTDKSKNGTYINGQRIAKDAVLQLHENDVLRLADVPSYAAGCTFTRRLRCVLV